MAPFTLNAIWEHICVLCSRVGETDPNRPGQIPWFSGEGRRPAHDQAIAWVVGLNPSLSKLEEDICQICAEQKRFQELSKNIDPFVFENNQNNGRSMGQSYTKKELKKHQKNFQK